MLVRYLRGLESRGTPDWVGPRGLFAGGDITGNDTEQTDYIEIATPGNATTFGNLTRRAGYGPAGCSDGSRGLFGAGSTQSPDIIDYFTIATIGNAIDFGDLTPEVDYGPGACSDGSRGLFTGGYLVNSKASNQQISYVTIATTGNSSTFGNMTAARFYMGNVSDATRGVFAGGMDYVSNAYADTMDYVTVTTTGNATAFGNMTDGSSRYASFSDATRGLFAGGWHPNTYTLTDKIDYITIATTGNASDFGNLTSIEKLGVSGCSDGFIGTIGGGRTTANYPNEVVTNNIDKITIATTSDATDFGDLTIARMSHGSTSGG